MAVTQAPQTYPKDVKHTIKIFHPKAGKKVALTFAAFGTFDGDLKTLQGTADVTGGTSKTGTLKIPKSGKFWVLQFHMDKAIDMGKKFSITVKSTDGMTDPNTKSGLVLKAGGFEAPSIDYPQTGNSVCASGFAAYGGGSSTPLDPNQQTMTPTSGGPPLNGQVLVSDGAGWVVAFSGLTDGTTYNLAVVNTTSPMAETGSANNITASSGQCTE
jgi:hypothetical protein